MITLMNLKQLHEIDDSQWLEETVKLLKNQIEKPAIPRRETS
ncbi:MULTISPECIES: hypothetical protein [Planktothricoides]|nr:MULTISPECIES: hypothetical protein [Planktothricoides]